MSVFRKPFDAAAYWVQWTALMLWGPATQDEDHDPIQNLKRRYGRPEHPYPT